MVSGRHNTPWEELPESKRAQYESLGIDRYQYDSDTPSTGDGSLSIPVFGQDILTGETRTFRVTEMSAEHEHWVGIHHNAIGKVLNPDSFELGVIDLARGSRGRSIDGIDAETGEPVSIVLVDDHNVIFDAQRTGELYFQEFYQRV